MADRAFADTNILVYAIEIAGADLSKSIAARGLLGKFDACLSTQVLGEFFSAVTSSRRESPLTHDEAAAWVQYWKQFDVHSVTTAHVDLAIEIAGLHGIKYYDALILATARFAGCSVVYSEDLNAGQDYGGVCVRNPFAGT
jgi:predicted nucleic acid-binding protein